MKPHERQQEIVGLLREKKEIRVADLAQLLDVSEGTIRADLGYLGQAGQVVRVRGGAALAANYQISNQAFAARARKQATAKQRIARWAADMVRDGEAIFLDASTTAFFMCEHLRDHRNLTVVTCGIEAAMAMAELPTCTVILVGGVVRQGSAATSGPLAERALEGLHIRTAFVSCEGFTVKAGMTDADIQMANTKRQAVRAAAQVIGLVESSKFGWVQVSSFASVDQVTQVLTDRDLDPKHIEELRHTRTVLTICGDTTTRSFAPSDESTVHHRIGFANLSEERPYAVEVRRSLEEAAQRSGHIDLVLGDNHYDSQNALHVAERLLAEGVDLAIEYHFDQQAGAILMDRFNEAGVPVISVDTPMIGATYFGVDNYRAGWDGGTALGTWIRDNWQGKLDKLIVLQHSAGGPLPAMRLTGQIDGLQSVIGQVAPSDTILIDNSHDGHETEREVLQILGALRSARRLAIISLSDATAEAIVAATRLSRRTDHVATVAQGAGTRVIREELRRPNSMLVAATLFRPEMYGQPLIDLARRILNGEHVPPAVYLRHVVVDRHNIGDYYPEQATAPPTE
jgi:ribose transport system substrate-binding protein